MCVVMEREDIELLKVIREKLDDYGWEYILEINELEPEDVLFHMVKLWGMELPE